MSTSYAERARRLRRRENEQNEETSRTVTGHNERNEITHSNSQREVLPEAEACTDARYEIRKNSEPESVDLIAQRERWDMDATVAHIRSLSPEKLVVYRAAIAFDQAALRRADEAA